MKEVLGYAIALTIISTSALNIIGRTQSSGIKGILMCNDKPAANVKVKLYDDDRGIDMDDLLAEGKSDTAGHFQLQGYTRELTKIDPKMNIYHNCGDKIKLCQRKITIHIPDSYISSGQTAKKIYDSGTIQLAGKFSGEKRDCFN